VLGPGRNRTGKKSDALLFSERAKSAQRTVESRETSSSRFTCEVVLRPCGCTVAAMDHTGIGPYVTYVSGKDGRCMRVASWTKVFNNELNMSVITTGTSLCADGHMLRRRLNIGAVGVARRHGRLTNGPSGQNSRRRSPPRPDGMPSAPRGRRFSTPPWSQPFGPAQRRYHAGPEPTACHNTKIEIFRKVLSAARGAIIC
jgi:hypothetical protein